MVFVHVLVYLINIFKIWGMEVIIEKVSQILRNNEKSGSLEHHSHSKCCNLPDSDPQILIAHWDSSRSIFGFYNFDQIIEEL